ncbi:MAG: LURP-one-related/scramblase family protein [Nocardioidaceae bacterium]
MTRYQMRQKLLSFGDDFWVEDADGERVFRVNGKALRLRDTLDIEDATGAKVCRVQTRVLHFRDTMAVEDPHGNRMALVHKALITPIRERWKVDVDDGPDLTVKGNVLDHEYTVKDDGTTVASVSKKWFRVRDTYGIEIAPDRDPVLLLAVSVALDAMAHPER